MFHLVFRFALATLPPTNAEPTPINTPPRGVDDEVASLPARSDAAVRKRPTSHVKTWNDERVVAVQGSVVHLATTQLADGVWGATYQVQNFPQLSLSYIHPLARRFVIGACIGVTSWELDNAKSSGYGRFWAVDLALAPTLRLPFGRRGRTGLRLGVPAGLTLDVAPTNDELFVVREKAGLGIGWHAALDVSYYFFISEHIGIQVSTFTGPQRLRHNWRFSTSDGSLDGARQVVRYQSWRYGAMLGLLVAF